MVMSIRHQKAIRRLEPEKLFLKMDFYNEFGHLELFYKQTNKIFLCRLKVEAILEAEENGNFGKTKDQGSKIGTLIKRK
jgi:hypothetical protein